VIEAVHLDQVREHGGLLGIRDEAALESALARPQQKWYYGDSPDIVQLAAAYAFGLSSNHPFRDGNKRIAFLAALIFLGLNGFSFDAPEDEIVETMLALASGDLTEEALADWIRSRSQPPPHS
jgi:death-on-curing protein